MFNGYPGDHPAQQHNDFVDYKLQQDKKPKDLRQGAPFSDPAIATSPGSQIVVQGGGAPPPSGVGARANSIPPVVPQTTSGSTQSSTVPPVDVSEAKVLKGLRVWLDVEDPASALTDPTNTNGGQATRIWIEEGAVKFSDGTIRVFANNNTDGTAKSPDQFLSNSYTPKPWNYIDFAPSPTISGTAYRLGETIPDPASPPNPPPPLVRLPYHFNDVHYNLCIGRDGLLWQTANIKSDILWLATFDIPAMTVINGTMCHDMRTKDFNFYNLVHHEKQGTRQVAVGGPNPLPKLDEAFVPIYDDNNAPVVVPPELSDIEYPRNRIPHQQVFERKHAEQRQEFIRTNLDINKTVHDPGHLAGDAQMQLTQPLQPDDAPPGVMGGDGARVTFKMMTNPIDPANATAGYFVLKDNNSGAGRLSKTNNPSATETVVGYAKDEFSPPVPLTQTYPVLVVSMDPLHKYNESGDDRTGIVSIALSNAQKKNQVALPAHCAGHLIHIQMEGNGTDRCVCVWLAGDTVYAQAETVYELDLDPASVNTTVDGHEHPVNLSVSASGSDPQGGSVSVNGSASGTSGVPTQAVPWLTKIQEKTFGGAVSVRWTKMN